MDKRNGDGGRLRAGIHPDDPRRGSHHGTRITRDHTIEQGRGSAREIAQRCSETVSYLFETLWQDLRFGTRTLFRNPGFAAIAILTLALGIGANAAIFSVLNAVLLKPLPWAEPDRAVMIWSKWTAFDKTWVAEGEVVDYRKRSRTLQEVATWGEGQVNLTGDQEPERVAGARVSANTFSTLGVAPMIGRTFTAQEDLPNGPQIGRARATPSGIGATRRMRRSSGEPILINGNSFEVVGIMPPGFVLPTDYQNPEPTQLWTPLQMDPAAPITATMVSTPLAV